MAITDPENNIVPEPSGIISSAVPQTTQEPPELDSNLEAANSYEAPTVAPVQSEVNAEQETVESRLNNLTSGSSAYVTQARRDAAREANSRGLINSSIAAGAGQEAAIRQALPIAQQDAKTYTDTRLNNQQAENEFLANRQSANLNMETAAHENTLAMSRDERSAVLNERRDALQSELSMIEDAWAQQLSTNAELILNDARFSDELKLQYVGSINNIIRDTQDQIVQIGLSDRTAQQQAEAIALVEANRDASIAVYEDLLGEYSDWDWGNDFTPGEPENSVSSTVAPGTFTSTSDLGSFDIVDGVVQIPQGTFQEGGGSAEVTRLYNEIRNAGYEYEVV